MFDFPHCARTPGGRTGASDERNRQNNRPNQQRGRQVPSRRNLGGSAILAELEILGYRAARAPHSRRERKGKNFTVESGWHLASPAPPTPHLAIVNGLTLEPVSGAIVAAQAPRKFHRIAGYPPISHLLGNNTPYAAVKRGKWCNPPRGGKADIRTSQTAGQTPPAGPRLGPVRRLATGYDHGTPLVHRRSS